MQGPGPSGPPQMGPTTGSFPIIWTKMCEAACSIMRNRWTSSQRPGPNGPAHIGPNTGSWPITWSGGGPSCAALGIAEASVNKNAESCEANRLETFTAVILALHDRAGCQGGSSLISDRRALRLLFSPLVDMP